MHDLGRRLRELRSWRRLNLREAADLAGISYGYLGRIERGEVPVNSRATIEALAAALRVAPTELTTQPLTAIPDNIAPTIPALVDALTGWSVGEVPDVPARPWGEIAEDLRRLEALRVAADYAGQLTLLPGLIRDLLVAATNDSTRVDALVGLLYAYRAAGQRGRDIATAGVSALAAERMRQAAAALDDPAWLTYADYYRAHLLSGSNRARQYELATRVAEDESARAETRGMANLTAALACSVRGDTDAVDMHLNEAETFANTLDTEASPWGVLEFGRANVGIWRVAIGVEMGIGAKVAELAERVHSRAVSKERQAAFWIDYGRGLLSDRKHAAQGIAALLNAEAVGAQKLRTNVFAREAVADQLRKANGDSAGRELRGLAWRMGVAPAG